MSIDRHWAPVEMCGRLNIFHAQVNIYIKSMQDYAAMNKVYAEIIPDPKPARTCVAIADLPFGTDVSCNPALSNAFVEHIAGRDRMHSASVSMLIAHSRSLSCSR